MIGEITQKYGKAVISKKEKELWGGSMLITWGDTDEILFAKQPVTLNGEVLNG